MPRRYHLFHGAFLPLETVIIIFLNIIFLIEVDVHADVDFARDSSVLYKRATGRDAVSLGRRTYSFGLVARLPARLGDGLLLLLALGSPRCLVHEAEFGLHRALFFVHDADGARCHRSQQRWPRVFRTRRPGTARPAVELCRGGARDDDQLNRSMNRTWATTFARNLSALVRELESDSFVSIVAVLRSTLNDLRDADSRRRRPESLLEVGFSSCFVAVGTGSTFGVRSIRT